MDYELEETEWPLEPKPPRETEDDDERDVLMEAAERVGAAPSAVRAAGADAAPVGTRTGSGSAALSTARGDAEAQMFMAHRTASVRVDFMVIYGPR